MTSDRRTKLLLLGAGHAHLEVLRRLAAEGSPPFAATVVSPARHVYSGMVPGYLAGRYGLDEIVFDVPALAAQAGAEHVRDLAAGLDPAARRVTLAGGGWREYDLVSVDVGSLAAGADAAAVARAETIKPLERAVRLRERLEALARGGGEGEVEARTSARETNAGREAGPPRIVVVGGGAAGVEVACAAAAAMRAGGPSAPLSPDLLPSSADRGGPAITLIEAGPALLPEHAPAARRRAAAALAALGVGSLTGRRVIAVEPDRVRLDDGSTLAADLAIWLTGAAGAPFLAASGLPVDGRGFLLVDDRLRSVGDRRVFAAGDCATLRDWPKTPKAGVNAVRQAPVLWRNLVAAAGGGELARFRPQRRFLALLDTGDGRAILAWGRIALWSRWAARLKERIDRGFVRRYRRLAG